MGKPQRRKHNTAKNKVFHRIMKTKHFQKHADQKYEDIQPENIHKYENQPLNEELPGLGQFYCIHCAKYFINATSLEGHKKTKDHKRQVKELKTKPYDLKEAQILNKY